MATARSPGGPAPETDAAPTLGLVLAGVALAASFLPWTGQQPLVTLPTVEGSAVAAVAALVATLAFGVRRHGALGRRVGAALAGLGCAVVAAVAVYRLVSPAVGGGSAPAVAVGLPVAGIAGLIGASVAVADGLALPDDLLWARLRATAVALVVGFLGFVVSSVVGVVLAVPSSAIGNGSLSLRVALLTAGSGVGLVLFTVVYLRYRDLGWDYLDVARPDRSDVVYAVGGLVVLFVAAGIVSATFQQLGLPSATSSIERLAEDVDRPVFLLVLIPLSFLAIGPGEELVYRNVVQKYLYDAFSRRTAVVVASVAFAAVHFSQYADPNPVATLSTLFVVFVLSFVLGYTYYRTENLLVPVFIHGAFNAIQFLLLYLQLTGQIPAN